MIYQLTTYHVPPAQMEALRAEREESAWPRLAQAGAVPLALWRVLLGGRPDEVLELVRFDSLVHWQEATRAGLDDLGATLPATTIALQPLSRRHPGGEPVPVTAENVWALRRMLPKSGTAGRVVALTEDHLWPGFWADSQAEERLFTLGIMNAHVAERHELYMITYYATLGDWEGTRDGAGLAQTGESGREAREAIVQRQGMLDEGGVRFLGALSRRGPKRPTCTEVGGGR